MIKFKSSVVHVIHCGEMVELFRKFVDGYEKDDGGGEEDNTESCGGDEEVNGLANAPANEAKISLSASPNGERECSKCKFLRI